MFGGGGIALLCMQGELEGTMLKRSFNAKVNSPTGSSVLSVFGLLWIDAHIVSLPCLYLFGGLSTLGGASPPSDM